MPRARKPQKKATRRLVGYIRVSTEKQKEEGLSQDAQVEKIEAYAKLHGIDLVGIESDEGRSASNLRRPGLQQTFQVMEDGRADGILVVKLDRITRSVTDLGYLIAKYFGPDRGYELVAVLDTIDTSTANGRMLITLLTTITQWERESAGERTRDVAQWKMSRGEFCGGQPPFGFSTEERDGVLVLVKNETEMQTARKIKALRKRGLSYPEIAKRLNERISDYPSRSSNGWNSKSVFRALKRVYFPNR